MRPVNQKRPRGGRSGGRRPHMMGGHRNFDSNGPDIKIRGTASHIFDRYCQLARDANAQGDRISAENYLQHAEHYYRIMVASGAAQQRQQQNGQPQTNGGQPGGFYDNQPEGGEVDADPNAEEAPI